MPNSKIFSALLISLLCLFASSPQAYGAGNTTTTALAVSSNNVSAGTAITLTATVTGQVPVAAGQVMFCDATALHCDGAALFGVAQVTSSHTAAITLRLGVGSYGINAVFASFLGAVGSASATQTITVTGAANYLSGAAIAATGTSIDYTLTGTVTAFGKAPSTATVSFLDTSNGNAVVASAALNPATVATVLNQAPGAPLKGLTKVQYAVAADFNHDGIPDLAVIDGRIGVGHVFIYLGRGDGSFQTAVSYNVGSSAFAMAVADVNGDGNPDLIVANELSANVGVLLGNADGTFQAQVTYATGALPIFVAVGDFNGDGWPDLAVVNTGAKSVGILLNKADGTGTFLAQVTYATGPSGRGVAVGDFNNDGILDLAVDHMNASLQPVVSIFPGIGNGTFGAKQDVALPLTAFGGYLIAGDLRQNGTLDLVVPDIANLTGSLYVLLGNNDGTFQAAVTYLVPAAPLAAALGDVDGDGVLDLVVADTGADGLVSVLHGLGDGTFGTRTDYPVGNHPNNAALADFNGDGLLDIATSDGSSTQTSVLLQARTETASATGVLVIGAGTHNVLASFPGDTDRASSQSTTVPLIGFVPTSTTTVLLVTPSPGYTGSPVFLTATVSPTPAGGSLGTVSFYDGATLLATVNLNASGGASFSTSSLAIGSHSLTAVYSGNPGFLSSTSSVASETVSASSASTTSLTLSSAAVVSGTPITLTSTVLVGSTPVTSGTVLFCDATAARCADTALLGTAQLQPNGTAVLKLTFGVGQYSIDAVFEATNPDQRSVSATNSLAVTGNAGYPSTTTIAASGSVGNYTLVGTVGAFGKSAFRGNVSFLDTSNGNAVVAAAALDPVTLVYGVVPASGSPLAEGNGPYNVASGDFNNDGILDFAVVDNNNPTISVYLGNGDGSFAAAVTYPIDDLGLDIKVGDFNGDGKLDIVTANGYENTTLDVLLGNGDGTFQKEVTYNAGASPSGIAIGDFNHDGILDLAVANDDAPGTVSIFLGNGDGTFQTQVKYPAGFGPFYIATADFNGDGILDLATANNLESTVSVLLGNGDGSFQPPVTYAAGSSPDYILVADVNHDGKPDLVVANYDDDTLGVYLGNGDGTFQPQILSPTGSGPNDLAVGDFNGDGKLDIAVTNNNTDSVSILFGDGLGNFGATQLTLTSGNVPWGIAVGDFNGDGLPDLVATNNSDDTVSIFLNQKTESGTSAGVFIPGFSGTHDILASYPGDSSRAASQSATVPLTAVPPASTTTVLTAAPSPAFAGRSVTLIATVSPTPVGATLGAVSFFNGPTLLGTVTLDSSGVGVFLTASLPVGVNSITAVYSGNAGFLTSTSSAVDETIAATTATTISLSLSASSVVMGTPVTLTATALAGATPVTSGQVLFCDASATNCNGPGLFGSAQLTSGGTASLNMKFGAGAYSIAASFTGANSDQPSVSAAQALTVTGNAGYASTTTIAASGSTGNYTLTSTVTGFGGTVPSGTLSFLNTSASNALVATANLDPLMHSFTFLPSADSPIGGFPAVQFVATGDFNHDGIADLAVLSVGSPGTVAVSLGNGDGTFGKSTSYDVGSNPQSITVADVNQDGKLDLLVCNMYDNTVSILLGNGDGTFQPQLTTATRYYPIFIAVGDFNHDGIPDMATADWDDQTLGIHLGNGDGTFQPEVTYSASSPYGLVIGDFNQDGIEDIATAYGGGSHVEVFFGVGDGTFRAAQRVDLPSSASAYWMAGGDLRKNGRSDLVVADDSNAQVYVLLSNGDGTFAPAVSYAVGGTAQGVSLGDINGDGKLDIVVPAYSSSSVSILLGNGDGTFAAKVDYPVGGAPTWAALADVNGDGALDIVTSDSGTNTATILLQAQTATATATGVAVYGTGNQLVNASFPGDAERAPSQSGTVPLTGSPQTPTSTSLTAAPNPANLGQSVTLTATVSPAPTGASLGTVSFFDGATLLGTGNVNSSGVAAFSTASLTAGAHGLNAVYSGNAGFTTSTSAGFTETINALTSTATALVALPNPATVGQTVTLTATVSPAPTGSPLGTVSFFDGATLLGSGNVNSSGVATVSPTTLAVGTHSLTALYSGNAGFVTSTSSVLTETINITALTSTTTILTAAPNPAAVGQAVTLTATISPPPTGGSLGTVSFFDGATLLGSGNVNSSGVATFSISSLAAGVHSLTAVYSGNSGFAASTSTPVSETISTQILLTPTATVFSAAPNPLDDGQSVTLTATVSPAPTGSSLGTVSFFNVSTLLGVGTLNSSGVATFSATSLPAGSSSLTAVYSGNSGFAASTSSPFTETVNPGFTVTALPALVTVAQGGAIDINVTVPPLGGAFNQPVTLSAGGLPPGATASFNPATVTPGASGAPTVMTLQLAKLAAAVSGKPGRAPAGALLFASLLLGACCLSGIRRKRWLTQLRLIAFSAVLTVAAIAMVGCGGGFLSPPTTHSGQYVVTITGTSGSVQASTTVTVVVR
jgi:hypothetical protein